MGNEMKTQKEPSPADRVPRVGHARDEDHQIRQHVRAIARETLGVTGEHEAPPLRSAIASSGVGWYPLFGLAILVMVDEFQSYGFLVLGPEISGALGIGKSTLAGIAALKTLALMLATLPMAAYVQRRARRAAISIVTAFGWAVVTLFTGFVTAAWMMAIVLAANGMSGASVRAVHPSLLMDSYPPEVRVRGLSFYRAADAVGNILAPLLVATLTTIFYFTWRGVFLIMGLTCLAAAFVSVRLRDPGFGRWDTSRVREQARQGLGVQADPGRDESIDLKVFEIARRLLLIPTVRRVLTAYAVLGMLLIPLYTFLFFFLEERWRMGPGARGLFFSVVPVSSVAILTVFGKRWEATFRRDPARLLRLGAVFLGGGVILLALSIISPVFALMGALFSAAFALFAAVNPILNISLLSIVPARMRPHVAALAGIALAGVGGFAGLVLLTGVESRFGTGGAIASLAVPGLIAALVLYTAARTINDDLDRMVDAIIEEETLRQIRAGGARVPMLACRGIDFSYSGVQVLFGVDFTVDDGEMVALLGTNGAGKSTLLRVISGLALPARGSVRLTGDDITYLDTERRLQLGLAHVPGGRAVFPRLSVVNNLRIFGHTIRRDRHSVARGIEATFEAFPRLFELRNQPAVTLSGGEQQMLGLGKALILRPQLLLIDELSLGLAPRVVGDLLAMVRRINETGSAIVLVEQSVNIALSVVEHAYFMEKGEIRFDGRARDLVGREDLLRSVFLEGMTRGQAPQPDASASAHETSDER